MNFLLPITPATTGPVWIPIRIDSGDPVRLAYASMPACMSSAMWAIAVAWSAIG